jgi:hypothetical protein
MIAVAITLGTLATVSCKQEGPVREAVDGR